MVEDLSSGRPAAPALSLLFYGGTLLVLTRILRPRHPACAAQRCQSTPVRRRVRARYAYVTFSGNLKLAHNRHTDALQNGIYRGFERVLLRGKSVTTLRNFPAIRTEA